MKKMLAGVAVLGLAIGFASVSAMAQTANLGCGGGNGASVPCNGNDLGTVNSTFTSGSMDVAITSSSGLPSIPLFTPQAVQFNLSFNNVGFTFSDGGTFSFTDIADPSMLSVTGEAAYILSPEPTDIMLGLQSTSVTFDGSTFAFSASGTANIALAGDPAVTSMTGSISLPTSGGGGATPEPGTLLLLGSGLLGFAPVIRRKLVRG